MSGSGGGGFSSVQSGGMEDVDCSNLTFETLLASPKEDVVNDLNVHDILTIDLLPQTGGVVIVVLNQSGKVAGGIASPMIGRLRMCLEQGNKFIAQVLLISGGQVKIKVSFAGE